uniref:NOL1/NOP2/Sun domain family member 4 n=1 Tax=Hydatigena taeniaeformis TaxID=6205 RepID=A0A0R3XBZ9_HYDTA
LNKSNVRILDEARLVPPPHCENSSISVAGRKFLVERMAPPDQDPTERWVALFIVAQFETRLLLCLFSFHMPHLFTHCDFYPLDLGSVLTVLMLDLHPGTRMLDLCSAPGGKAVTALQTLNLERLVCTDVSESRLERLRRVLMGFAWGVGSGRDGLPDVEVTTVSALHRLKYRSGEHFSRVLVDVPCSTDRDALTSPTGGYFARGKASARVGLVEKQRALLR